MNRKVSSLYSQKLKNIIIWRFSIINALWNFPDTDSLTGHSVKRRLI